MARAKYQAKTANGHADWNLSNAHPERIGANKSAFQRVCFCLHPKQPASLTQQAQAAIKNEAEILKCEHNGLAHLKRCPPPQGEAGPSHMPLVSLGIERPF